MALSRRFAVSHAEVFAHGAFLVSEVTPVIDFEASSKEKKVQARDKDTGLPLWSVDVLDADPEARKQSKTVSVKIAATHQPVPPANTSGFPFTLVEFEGLTALPYVDENGARARLAWSFRADGIAAPGKATSGKPGASSSSSSSSSAASSSGSSSASPHAA